MKNKEKKQEDGQKFRKDVIDIALIIPKVEGQTADCPAGIARVSINKITDVDFMSVILRGLFIGVCEKDKQLNKMFKKYFAEQEIEKWKIQKAMRLAEKKAMSAGEKPIKPQDSK